MRIVTAAGWSAAFFVVAPGVVAGLGPWLITRWHTPYPWDHVGVLLFRAAGLGLLLAAVPALVAAFARFVREGRGTPAPVAPTTHLVVGGPYRRIRNPMYAQVVAVIAGQGLLLVRPEPLLYGIAVWLVCAAFVRWYEEPALHRAFGADYDAYRAVVPAWLPRRRPR
ncbi:isoprenylcysteine carboxylmethyltransferase family protein [Streptomyces sp. B6B3]|uniref:methyltransferase family protein n=1 Tax=Streptomyces sp. B6B3 TaxID=3153570 RepID=UPI00325D9877